MHPIIFTNFGTISLMRLHFALLGHHIDEFDCLSPAHVLEPLDERLEVLITLLQFNLISFGLLIIFVLSHFFFILARLPFIATDVKNHYRSF